MFTVIGIYESTGETWVEFVEAGDAHEAMAVTAGCREDPADLTILGAFPGKLEGFVPACEDSGKAACALDLIGGDGINA